MNKDPLKPNNATASSHNQHAWDQLADRRQRFTSAAKDEEFSDPLRVVDGSGWLGTSVSGRSLLCLAAGGGRQGPLYAAAGARVTVVDVSPRQLEHDRAVARERNLDLRTVHTSMDDLSMFADGEFDIVIHPVSTCYVPDIKPVYQQIARVTRAEGLYVSQHKQPASLQAEVAPGQRGYELSEPYYRKGPLPAVVGSLHREEGTFEFLHRWEQLLGCMCRAGFSIEDIVEPCHADPLASPGTFAHRCQYIAPYVRVKARRRTLGSRASEVWLP